MRFGQPSSNGFDDGVSGPQNSAGFQEIWATFQRDNLRRHFSVRIRPPQPGSPVSWGFVRLAKIRIRAFREGLSEAGYRTHPRDDCGEGGYEDNSNRLQQRMKQTSS